MNEFEPVENANDSTNSGSAEPVNDSPVTTTDYSEQLQQVITELQGIKEIERQEYMTGVSGHITDETILESLSEDGQFYSSSNPETYDVAQLQNLNESIVYLNGLAIVISVLLTILIGIVVGRVVTDRLHK